MEEKQRLVDLLNALPSKYHFIQYAAKKLQENGYQEITEDEDWTNLPEKFFVVYKMGTIFAMKKKDLKKGVILATNLFISKLIFQPNTYLTNAGLDQARIGPCGLTTPMIWFDIDLKLVGSVTYKENGKIASKIIDTKKPVAIIPSLPAELHNTRNEMYSFAGNALYPVFSYDSTYSPTSDPMQSPSFYNIIAKEAGCQPSDIIDHDLSLYSSTPANINGISDEMICGPNVGQITSALYSLESFLSSDDPETGYKAFLAFEDYNIYDMSIRPRPEIINIILEKLGITHESKQNSFMLFIENRDANYTSNPSLAVRFGAMFGSGVVLDIKSYQKNQIDLDTRYLIEEIAKRGNIKFAKTMSLSNTFNQPDPPALCLGVVTDINIATVGIPILSLNTPRAIALFDDLINLKKICLSTYNEWDKIEPIQQLD